MDKLKDDVVQVHQKVDEISSAVEVRSLTVWRRMLWIICSCFLC